MRYHYLKFFFAKETEQSSPKSAAAVVGIGASAGGVQALQDFFRHTPEKTGIAFVVILHLSPDHDSKLAEVLRYTTNIPVSQVHERTLVQPDHVYVVPPNKHLMMSDGYVDVSPNTHEEDRRAPVDIFFRTLANSHGRNAVCVVLSGTGANGSMGLKRVKEAGGAIFVQNPREAEFNEMPRNSIATDLVDEVLPVADIPAKIIKYLASLDSIQIPLDPQQRAEDQQHALREVFNLLRMRTGHDFSNYKRPTLLRRIERRINIRNLPDLPAYAAYLRENPEEIAALLKDLLISVTNFFRDKKAFEILEQEVIPKIVDAQTNQNQIRVWVAGCATGEEAYSLAMLFAEKMDGSPDPPKVQIFATDIDEAAISFAREGYFTLNDAADVSPERLRRFFAKEGDGFRIRREIREMVLFATHNFLKDPPFSHLDLISCRNVLIYLNHTAQERVLETFHFALDDNKFLFLGSSESADGATDLFTNFNRESHIFQARYTKIRSFPVPETAPIRARALNIPAPPAGGSDAHSRERLTVGDLHLQLLEQYAPPSLVVDEEYNLIHLSKDAGKYLQMLGGEPSKNLLTLIRPELRLELRSALFQSLQRRMPVEARGLRVLVDQREETVNILLRPVFRELDPSRAMILVIFEQSHTESGTDIIQSTNEPVAVQLEEELLRAKFQLRDSVEHHEFQAEELKASNEELQAMNEELRSSAEELETSKEELQSINEELRTVNQELKIKVEETTITGNNLKNLINSVDIGTIFLDRNFKVVLFTPAASHMFNLISGDIGRPLSDITNKLETTDIIADAEIALEKLQVVEREVRTSEGRSFTMRVLPYRTELDRINGVVVTFFDITQRKHAEEQMRRWEERYRIALQSADMAAWDWNITDNIIIWNAHAQFLFGTDGSNTPNTIDAMFEFVSPDDRMLLQKAVREALNDTGVLRAEFRVIKGDSGKMRWMSQFGRIVSQEHGGPSRMVGVLSDITEKKLMEEQKDEFIGIASHELKTPVTSIRIYSEILQERFEASHDAASAELMRKLTAQVDRLTDLIGDLLDTTKITEGKLPLNLQEFSVNDLINEQIEALQAMTQKHVLTTQLAELPLIIADRERIGQVITNLLSNAIKYSPGGGDIILSSAPTGDGIKVTVQDRGIGISEESKQKIFERFFRANLSNLHTFPGMGLGLYISMGIIERHGGTLTMISQEGEGSSFSFSLPLRIS